MSTQTLEQKFEMLPSELQKEAADFIAFLHSKVEANRQASMCRALQSIEK